MVGMDLLGRYTRAHSRTEAARLMDEALCNPEVAKEYRCGHGAAVDLKRIKRPASMALSSVSFKCAVCGSRDTNSVAAKLEKNTIRTHLGDTRIKTLG